MAETTTDYGADGDWGADGPDSPVMPWVTGARAVGLCLARNLSTPTGSVEYWPNTINIADFLESNASDATIKAAVERVVNAEERIQFSTVKVSRSGGTVTITIAAYLSTGSFTLVLSATDAAVSLVSLTENA
jgi:hypothetical protein